MNGTCKPITEKDIKSIENCTDPTMLMLISNSDQMKYQFTVQEKKGIAMYENIKEDKKGQQVMIMIVKVTTMFLSRNVSLLQLIIQIGL